MSQLARQIILATICFVAILLTLPQRSWAQMSAEDAQKRAVQLCDDSIPLFNALKYEQAESKLAEAYRLDPQNCNVLNNYGLCFLKLGQLPEAKAMLEKSIELNPKFETAYLNLGLVAQCLGDLEAAKRNLSKFVELAPHRAETARTKERLKIIDSTLASGTASTVASSKQDDYLSQVPVERLHPWAHDHTPVSVYFEPGDQIPGYKPSYGMVLNNALAAWSEALCGFVSFRIQEKPEGADINVHWTHDFKGTVSSSEGGDCRFTATGAGLKHADITLLTADPSPFDKLTDSKVSWVALHEFGHALGFGGHSNNPRDIMYFAAPQKYAMQPLSSRDIHTFTRLYSEKLEDTWLSLNDQALKLNAEGKHQEALDKINAALKINPKEPILRKNMTIMENWVAISLLQEEKYADAEPHLLRALEMEKHCPNEALQSLLVNYSNLLRKTGRSPEADAICMHFARTSHKKK